MYSVVLMVALTGGAETPALGHGCCGYSCHGCHGHKHKHSCHGCCGYSCHGCCGHKHSCHGCGGHKFFSKHHSCCGCHGCCGYSCHGCCGYSCSGCCGYSCSGCCGYSCSGCCGYSCSGCCGYSGVIAAPAIAPVITPAPAPMPLPGKKISAVDATAKVIVNLPADARLTVDGVATTSVSDRREFVSPELPAGQTFTYNLKAEYTQNGQPVVVTKAVEVKAGAEINVRLFAAEAVASR